MTLAASQAVGVTLQTLPFDDPDLLRSAGRLLGFTLASFVVATLVSLVYRWYTREPVPLGVVVLLGLSVVAVYLNTVGLFGQLLGGQTGGIFELEAVVYNLLALLLAAGVTPVGRAVGDRMATDVFAVAGVKELDAEVSRIVRTVGRVTDVTLPEAEDIGDIDGYDPVPEEVKAEMAEKTLLFPSRLTVTELRDRFVSRLKEDYRVGHVDAEFDDGRLAYLAVGSRAAGVGPTLGHGTVAIALEADPANAASPGDIVQVWRPARVETDADGTELRRPPERVVTGELRGRAGDVVTVVVDAADAGKLSARETYRLVSLPAEPQVEREFASLLRAADETMGALTVTEASDVVGETLGSLDITVAAVRAASGQIEAIPTRTRAVEVGDTLYVIARPETLRRLEAQLSVVVETPPAAELTADD